MSGCEAHAARVVALARTWIGTPYHDQESVRGAGCDCLGLARGVWRDLMGPEPEAVPPYSRDWGETGREEVMARAAARWMISIDLEEAGPGDLVLFRMQPRAIAKHCGILAFPRQNIQRFIHAYERLGVVEQALSPWWRRRIAFAFRYPAGE